MWGLDLETWNNIIVGFLALGAISAVIVGVATYVSFQLQKQETASAQTALAKYQLETAGKVADATTAGIAAGKAAGNAQAAADDAHVKLKQAEATIAQANARAAEANQTAETERLERLKLEARLAPRGLSAVQAARLTDAARRLTGIEVDLIAYPDMGTDVPELARQVEVALFGGGMVAKTFTPMGGSGIIHGILVRCEEGAPSEVQAAVPALVKALNDAGLNAGAWDAFPAGEPPAGAYNGPGSATAKLRILIGSKL